MAKILLNLFFIVHGLIHLSFISPAPPAKVGAPVYPFNIKSSPWLPIPSGMAQTIGTILTVISVVGFVMLAISSVGFLIPAGWFKAIAIISSVSSLLLIGIFWNNWFVVGALLDFAIIAWVLFIRK